MSLPHRTPNFPIPRRAARGLADTYGEGGSREARLARTIATIDEIEAGFDGPVPIELRLGGARTLAVRETLCQFWALTDQARRELRALRRGRIWTNRDGPWATAHDPRNRAQADLGFYRRERQRCLARLATLTAKPAHGPKYSRINRFTDTQSIRLGNGRWQHNNSVTGCCRFRETPSSGAPYPTTVPPVASPHPGLRG